MVLAASVPGLKMTRVRLQAGESIGPVGRAEIRVFERCFCCASRATTPAFTMRPRAK